MSELKLSDRLMECLSDLESCAGPWNAQHHSNRMCLRRLERLGLAELHELGWIITPAGRAALSSAAKES